MSAGAVISMVAYATVAPLTRKFDERMVGTIEKGYGKAQQGRSFSLVSKFPHIGNQLITILRNRRPTYSHASRYRQNNELELEKANWLAGDNIIMNSGFGYYEQTWIRTKRTTLRNILSFHYDKFLKSKFRLFPRLLLKLCHN